MLTSSIRKPANNLSHGTACETGYVQSLLPGIGIYEPHHPTITANATRYAKAMRKDAIKSQGVERFLSTYGLDSKEGIALMCVAEALLRIPDKETADTLIDDSLSSTQWKQFLGKSQSLQVNAATWGLLLTGKVLNFTADPANQGMWQQMLERYGEPIIREALRKAMRYMGDQFILGITPEEALDRAEALLKQGCRLSLDMLGEGARSLEQAERFTASYHEAIDALSLTADTTIPLHHRHSLSIKLSALHPRYSWTQHDRVMDELLPTVRKLVDHAQNAGIAISIDAEEASRFDIGFALFKALIADPAFTGYDGLGYVLQVYQTRALQAVEDLASLAREHKKKIPIRLVKGAYWDSEIKQAQLEGLTEYPVYTRKCHTDISYLACATRIIHAGQRFFPQFATHNPYSAAAVCAIAGNADFECQRLYGMGKALYDQLVKDNVACRVYAPVGSYRDLLPYLIRRMLENGANSSFVQKITRQDVDLNQLILPPQQVAAESGYTANPRIPMPENLYGSERKNSPGMDFGHAGQMKALTRATAFFRDYAWEQDSKEPAKNLHEVTSPANLTDKVGRLQEADVNDLESIMEKAQAAFPAWNAMAATARAECLDNTANLFWRHRHALLALLAREGGRTLHDGLFEIREAMDFCRYYAAQLRRHFSVPRRLPGPTGEDNHLTLHGRGVFACISPWNFPLAIFTGQVSAALATGNTVIAKPARQTPLVAQYAVRLMHEAGIPADVLHLVPGPGRTIGDAIMAHPALAGVAFTGSTSVAQHINRKLAARDDAILPFIAETGGQNCMIVDSSALLEQTVDDVLVSAFGSAGQRCSALRVLYIQEEVFDPLTGLIKGAMQELSVGHPLELATDVGPVIDRSARSGLQEHITRMEKEATLLTSTPIDAALADKGSYLAPHAFIINHIAQLKEEVFGPILHILPFAAHNLDQVISDINHTGYGLTFGIQSRIVGRARQIADQIRAGNRYINRSMIGATVGVQPFGGERASGTGPKAGGPHYLQRFATERVTSHNTAALGGNIGLLNE